MNMLLVYPLLELWQLNLDCHARPCEANAVIGCMRDRAFAWGEVGGRLSRGLAPEDVFSGASFTGVGSFSAGLVQETSIWSV